MAMPRNLRVGVASSVIGSLTLALFSDTAFGRSPLHAGFTITIDGLTITVDGGVAVGDIQKYHWSFGDGATATGREATHTYARSGTYTVTLEIISGIRSDRISKHIAIGLSDGYGLGDFGGGGFGDPATAREGKATGERGALTPPE